MVELDGTRLTVYFVKCQTHRNPHKEDLRQFDAAVFYVQKVAVVECLQP